MKQSFLNNEFFIFSCLCISVLRIYLEVINFKFTKLPITKKMGANGEKFHEMGFYFCAGYIILFAPTFLFR